MTSKLYVALLTFTLFFTANLTAQDFPYYFSIDEQPFVEIEGTELAPPGWDDPEFVVPIDFEFLFMGDPVSNFYQIGTGAILTGEADYYYADSTNLLCVYGSDIIDLEGYGGNPSPSRISYALEGTPGNQICKVEWKNVGFYNDLNSVDTIFSSLSFQTWFYEGSNTIEIRFGPNDIVEDDEFLHEFGGDPFIGFFEGLDFNNYSIGNLYHLIGAEDTASVEELSGPSIYDLETIPHLTSNPIDGRVYRFTTAPFVNTNEPGLSQLVSIHPSLANDYTFVNINQQNFNKGSIQVINQIGQTVIQREAQTGVQRINLSNLSPGTYFVRIQIDGEGYSQAIVKQ